MGTRAQLLRSTCGWAIREAFSGASRNPVSSISQGSEDVVGEKAAQTGAGEYLDGPADNIGTHAVLPEQAWLMDEWE